MVKVLKNHPASKRGGDEKILTIDYMNFTTLSLTAMPFRAAYLTRPTATKA
jgi:hypothetical protein